MRKASTIVILLAFAAWAQQSGEAPQDPSKIVPPEIEPLKTTIVITAKPVDRGIGERGSRPPLDFLHFQAGVHIEMWGRLSTCGRLAIGLALDHGNSSGVTASPAVTGFLSM